MVVVGFDLDMTLVNSSEGICHAMSEILQKNGITSITKDDIYQTIGVPLRDAFALWIEEDKVDAVVAEYRAAFDELALHRITPLPFAMEALKALQELKEKNSVKVLVVSSRQGDSLERILDSQNMTNYFDVIQGGLFGEEKGKFLKEHNAAVYIGDHTGDIMGAKFAGALSIAVTTGPITKEVLEKSKPDHLWNDLSPFPNWLDAYSASNDCVNTVLRELKSP